MRFVNWIIQTITFYLKAALFLGVLALLFIYGTIHAAVYGGRIMPDDAWFFAKIIFLIVLPFVLLAAFKRQAAFFLGIIASLLLGCSPLFSWGNYDHAPQFREAKLYSIENGKLVVPEENRELFMRDCGFISHQGMKDTCRVIIDRWVS
jgi:energy-coupling factor transporter transmembrane protein EcfT